MIGFRICMSDEARALRALIYEYVMYPFKNRSINVSIRCILICFVKCIFDGEHKNLCWKFNEMNCRSLFDCLDTWKFVGMHVCSTVVKRGSLWSLFRKENCSHRFETLMVISKLSRAPHHHLFVRAASNHLYM